MHLPRNLIVERFVEFIWFDHEVKVCFDSYAVELTDYYSNLIMSKLDMFPTTEEKTPHNMVCFLFSLDRYISGVEIHPPGGSGYIWVYRPAGLMA